MHGTAQLQKLPCPLRTPPLGRALQVGWFLHTPFPSSEIYRTLPVREEVLRAVLRADLIGFHTYDYTRHFISSCTRCAALGVGKVGFASSAALRRGATP